MEPVTPIRKLLSSKVNIPASPFMKSLGYGTGIHVYQLDRSTSNKSQSPWAIKKLTKYNTHRKIAIQRLHEEASILRQMNHPNIVGFRAFTKDCNGKVCLAMEACCSSLGNLIEKRQEAGVAAFEVERILKVAFDTANALNYLHNTALIVHCDIKSYNILVKGNFEICKLCDFGVALSIIPENRTQQEEQPGTLPWMAPETLEDNIVSDKSDIYSYGLVVWEMLALVVPPLPEESSILDNTELSINSESMYSGSSDDYTFDASTSGLNIRKIGSRPELPPQEFTKDYNGVLGLFHCCTEADAKLRPNASDLVLITKKMQESISLKL